MTTRENGPRERVDPWGRSVPSGETPAEMCPEGRSCPLCQISFEGVALVVDGHFADVNPRFAQLLGCTAADVVGRAVGAFVAPESQAPLPTPANHGMPGACECLVRRKDGTAFPAEVHTRLAQLGSDTVQVLTLRDITGRRGAEQELRDALQVSADLVQAMPAGLYIYDFAPPDRLTLVSANPEAERLTGLKASEWVGREFNEIWPQARHGGVTDAYLEVMRTGRTYETEDLTYEDERLAGVFRIRAFRLPGSRLAVAFENVTAQRRAEEELRQSHARMQGIIDAAPFGAHAYELTSEGRLVFTGANEAADRILGVSNAQFVGKTIEEAFPALTATDLPSRYRRVAAAGVPFTDLRVDYEADGICGTFEVHAVPTGPNRMAAFFRDITEQRRAEEERRRLEEQVRHAQKLESLGVLAGGIAHDFNNLLMAILGNADLALLHLPEGHPARRNLRDVEAASQRAADLCRQMLAYAGKGQLSVERVDLSALVRGMGQILAVAVGKKATLRYDLAADLPPVEGDPTQLGQVLMNVLINAAEALGEGPGAVSVSTSQQTCERALLRSAMLGEDLPEGTYVRLEVTDTGSGMDETTLGRIFDPFFSTKFAGRGLGLAAVLGIVRRHRGAIRVESAPGLGTTFTVLFPAAEPAPKGDPRSVDAPAADGWSGRGLVLLADDEPEVRAVAAEMLRSLGFGVILTADGQEAVDLFGRHAKEISCTLLDLTMPRLGGEEAGRELRRLSPGLPVVFSSGYGGEGIAERFEGWGPVGFVQKPYTLSRLREALRGVLDGAAAGLERIRSPD